METMTVNGYECNDDMDQWNFENWRSRYWWLSPEFREHFQLG